MAGLGDNLSSLGGSLFQHGLNIHKQDLLTKLEKEKEERAEERLKQREERQLNSFGETRPEQLPNGSWVMQDYTKGGQKMGEPKPAPMNIVEELTTQQEANRASLESTLLGNTEKEFKVGNLEADRALDIRDKESQIAYRENQGLASLMRADKVTEKPNVGVSDAARALVDNYSSLIKSYTSGDEPALTQAEVEEVALQTAKAAVLQKVDASTLFRDELQRRATSKTSTDKLNFR